MRIMSFETFRKYANEENTVFLKGLSDFLKMDEI